MERLLDETEHSIAGHHSNHANAATSAYPPSLSHTAALQQHLAEVRMTRRQNRQQPQAAYENESPTAEYSGNLFMHSEFYDTFLLNTAWDHKEGTTKDRW